MVPQALPLPALCWELERRQNLLQTRKVEVATLHSRLWSSESGTVAPSYVALAPKAKMKQQSFLKLARIDMPQADGQPGEECGNPGFFGHPLRVFMFLILHS